MSVREEILLKIIDIPIKIIAIVIAIMIILRFCYVLYDFIQNPFHPPVTLSEEAVSHVMTGLILLELLTLTIRFLIEDSLDPNLIIITVLTAVGREIIVINFKEADALKIIAMGFIFAITIFGLYILNKSTIPEGEN
ncbi:MAG: phosphate-starvation-inducible PsiE family protein [Methanosarcinales archaeon]|nr:phosphate-starvation-inducible PsiE family protein [Methanosarcinales archaeon]